jgi:hypothetical protein
MNRLDNIMQFDDALHCWSLLCVFRWSVFHPVAESFASAAHATVLQSLAAGRHEVESPRPGLRPDGLASLPERVTLASSMTTTVTGVDLREFGPE